jgi:hypothetical protein
MTRRESYRRAMWELHDYVFYTNRTRKDRKQCLRRMIAYGLTAYQAIDEMRSIEREG